MATASQTQASAPGEEVELQQQSPFDVTSHSVLNEPWAIAFEPGTGRLLITEQGGTMRLFNPTDGSMRSVTGVPAVAYGGQGGLGAIAFAPDYPSSDMLYLSWVQQAPADAAGNGRRAVVGRGTLACEGDESCRIEDLRVIWQQEPAIESQGHFSHRLAFSPDGEYLFVSSGDRQQKEPAQNLANNLGTVVRLLPDGTAAPGNPWADRGAPTDQIWSYGHRNILGLGFDGDGHLWGLEHGPKGGDELNLIVRGANYGWPERSNGVNYNGSNIPDHSPDDGFTKPAISWTPVIAPGGMAFYGGDMWPEWRGDLLIANLKAQSISHVTLDAAGGNAAQASAEEIARYAFPERLRDIAVAPDGALWVIEDREQGRLLRLARAEQ